MKGGQGPEAAQARGGDGCCALRVMRAAFPAVGRVSSLPKLLWFWDPIFFPSCRSHCFCWKPLGGGRGFGVSAGAEGCWGLSVAFQAG